MRPIITLSVLLLLASCAAPTAYPRAVYERDSAKRRANIDDHTLYVVPHGGGWYVAWGGEETRDGYVEYRQRRAIELVTGCRVLEESAKPSGEVLMASVSC